MFGCLCRWVLLCLPMVCFAAPFSVQVINTDNGAITGAVVYLQSAVISRAADNGGEAAKQHPIEIQQKDKKFVPFSRVIRTGAPVLFTNQDDITHHVYSITGPARFSFKIRSGEHYGPLTFAEPGVIAMGCNIHDWMSGYLLVVDSDFVASTDEKGWAQFSDVPPGEYQLVVWHPQMREPHPLVRNIKLPGVAQMSLQLTRPLLTLPQQKGINDFDFLEGY